MALQILVFLPNVFMVFTFWVLNCRFSHSVSFFYRHSDADTECAYSILPGLLLDLQQVVSLLFYFCCFFFSQTLQRLLKSLSHIPVSHFSRQNSYLGSSVFHSIGHSTLISHFRGGRYSVYPQTHWKSSPPWESRDSWQFMPHTLLLLPSSP